MTIARAVSTDNSGQPEPYVGEPPAAHYLGISPRTLRRWVAAGMIPAHRSPSGRLRFRISELDAAMTRVPTAGNAS